jgi:hypothetical protein
VVSALVAGAVALDFGSVNVGASDSHALTLSNQGSGTVTGIALTVTGDYSVSQPCGASALNSGAGCTVQLSFAPTAAGTRTGTLTIASSDPGSPIVVSLIGVGAATGSFALTGATSATVLSGQPAAYAMTVTPLNGFKGTVALGCAAMAAAPNANCSLSTPSLSLSNGAAGFTVTINTVTEAAAVRGGERFRGRVGVVAWCVLLPCCVLLRRRRLAAMLLLCCVAMMPLAGCGSGTHLNVLTTPAGSYPFQVTATSVGGVAVTQTLNLNLTVQ